MSATNPASLREPGDNLLTYLSRCVRDRSLTELIAAQAHMIYLAIHFASDFLMPEPEFGPGELEQGNYGIAPVRLWWDHAPHHLEVRVWGTDFDISYHNEAMLNLTDWWKPPNYYRKLWNGTPPFPEIRQYIRLFCNR